MSAPSRRFKVWVCPDHGPSVNPSRCYCAKAEEVEVIPVADAEKLEAKVEKQRAYIDLLVKAGKGSEDWARRLAHDVANYQRFYGDLPPGVPQNYLAEYYPFEKDQAEYITKADFEGFKERLLSIAQDVDDRARATLKAGAARTGLFAEAAAIREAVAIASENPESTEEGP